jgi:L-lactate dehydrogenase (cytochrome)
MNMRLLGARSLEEVVPEMVDARSVGTHVVAGPTDRLYDSNCKNFSHRLVEHLLTRLIDDGLAVASLRDVKAKL